MIDWLKNAFNDLIEWLKAILQAVFDFFADILILVLDGVLSAVSSLLEAIPVPTFMTGGAQSLLNGLDGSILYFLSMSGFGAAMALIGAGYLFRFTRKIVTLFQW